MNVKYLRAFLLILLVLPFFGAKSPDKKFLDAALKGKTEKMLKYLEDINISERKRCIDEALYISAGKGYGDSVSSLLKLGADVNYSEPDTYLGSSGTTPLMWAAGSGHESIVKMLLENGADIKRQEFVFIVKEGTYFINDIKNCYEYEFTKTFEGRNALSRAIVNGHIEVVKLLLKHGADPNQKVIAYDLENQIGIDGVLSNRKNTKVNIGYQFGYFDIISEGSRGYITSTVPPEIWKVTPLILAVKNQKTEIVILLLQNGANVELADSTGKTPINYAKDLKNAEIIGILEKKKTGVKKE